MLDGNVDRHNKVFSGHIIARSTTCIQRCRFVQKQSVAQNVSNDNVSKLSKERGKSKIKGKRHNIQRHVNKQCCFMHFREKGLVSTNERHGQYTFSQRK